MFNEHDMDQQITKLESERDDLRIRLSQAHLALDEFKTQVREKAIEVAKENGWCKDGLNEVLDELGLERYNDSYTVTVSMEVVINVDLEGASDFLAGSETEYEIEQWVAENLSANFSESYSNNKEHFEIDSCDVDVRRVEIND